LVKIQESAHTFVHISTTIKRTPGGDHPSHILPTHRPFPRVLEPKPAIRCGTSPSRCGRLTISKIKS